MRGWRRRSRASEKLHLRKPWTCPVPNAKRRPVSDLSVTILTEKPEDAGPIERLHERTFGPGRHARTTYRIREPLRHRLELSYTAGGGTLLVGSVRLTAVRIGETPALLLGPLPIEPPFRERGI